MKGSTAAVLARVGEEGEVPAIERVSGRARVRNRWRGSWRRCWCARVAWKGNEEGEFVGAVSSSASGVKEKKERGGRWSGLYRERRGRPASTSPGDTGRQATACSHACTRRCTHGGRAGQGRRDPYRITVAVHIRPFLSLCEFDQKLNWSQISTKMKVVQNFTSYKSYFGAQN